MSCLIVPFRFTCISCFLVCYFTKPFPRLSSLCPSRIFRRNKHFAPQMMLIKNWVSPTCIYFTHPSISRKSPPYLRTILYPSSTLPPIIILTMEDLDFNIALDIARRVGVDSFTDMAGMLSTSKFYRKLAINHSVRTQISLQPFLTNPSLINLSSVYRPFFASCFEASNPSATYLESLRLACREGRAEEALSLLCTVTFPFPHASFARGLLEVCLGKYGDAINTIDSFVASVSSFEAADAIASKVFEQMIQIGPRKIRSHCHTWRFDEYPDCTLTGCRIDKRCRACFLYWFAVMYLVLC